MRSVDAATLAYLNSRAGVVARDFIWIEGKNRDTGATETVGFWNDLDTVTVSVISGTTGAVVNRDYTGSGSLIQIDAIPLVSDMSVRMVRVRLSQINETVALAIRGYEPRLAKVEMHRALFRLDSRALVAPPFPHYVGHINTIQIQTPPPGEQGSIMLQVATHSRELTRSNPAKKSDETQKLRSGDRFRRYADVAGIWDFFWGEKKGKANGGGGGSSKGSKARMSGKVLSRGR